jgi:hypothetical protein
VTRAEYERARRLCRHVSALRELPCQAPRLVERYWRLMERAGCWRADPLTVPLSRRLNDFKNGKEIPF